MFQDFSFRHLPAFYFAFSNCVGAVLTPLCGTSSVIGLYGLPPQIADVPETWPVWQAGQGRIILLGLLMHVFYWRRQYAVCDTLVMGVAWLGINDFMVAWNHGDRTWAWVRLFGSFAFASTGFFGLTQGPSPERKAR
ncbi:hypothetical protein DL767_002446 [Monosporascus sp. MG133]|nr:hypothetical protein DL767_002446 [Monosporascus sp. MG133]